jgi:hypothetical protein
VRVDGAEGIVGLLEPEVAAAPTGEGVEVQSRSAILWAEDDPRIPETSAGWLQTAVTLLMVGGVRPVTFVHCGQFQRESF